MGKFRSFFSYLPALHQYFSFRTITLVNLNGFSPNLICALILWRSALRLLSGKFRQFLTVICLLHDSGGYYRFTFYFIMPPLTIRFCVRSSIPVSIRDTL